MKIISLWILCLVVLATTNASCNNDIHNEADIELEVNEEDVGNDGESLNADEISSINCESDCEVAETIQEEDVTIGEENDETIEDSQPDTEIVEAPKLDANCHKKSESEKLSKIVRKTVKENKKKQKSDVKISSTKDNEVNDKQVKVKRDKRSLDNVKKVKSARNDKHYSQNPNKKNEKSGKSKSKKKTSQKNQRSKKYSNNEL